MRERERGAGSRRWMWGGGGVAGGGGCGGGGGGGGRTVSWPNCLSVFSAVAVNYL